jgi:hypothetical protein
MFTPVGDIRRRALAATEVFPRRAPREEVPVPKRAADMAVFDTLLERSAVAAPVAIPAPAAAAAAPISGFYCELECILLIFQVPSPPGLDGSGRLSRNRSTRFPYLKAPRYSTACVIYTP